MDSQSFREFGKAAVDFIADYIENIADRDVIPSVEPGYLSELLPTTAPDGPESWQSIMTDLEKFILPGITHWVSPHFHGYFPMGISYPSIVADIISNGFGVIGLSWFTSPSCTELEVIMMDWLAKFLNLPEHFLSSAPGRGGGVIQGSASESCVIALIVGRELAMKRHRKDNPEMTEGEIRSKLVAYSSDQCNSCIEKAGILAAVPLRLLATDENCSLRGETLKEAVEKDLAAGLIPCAVLCTLGTTQNCAFDNLPEIGPICEQYEMFLHVDAAYAGSAFCCDEYRHFMAGIEYVDSLNVNLHKAMLMNFDCCAMWLKDSDLLIRAMTVDRMYLKHKYEKVNPKAPDFRHWNIALGRRMRSLKVWFTLRAFGQENIRARIRRHAGFTRKFEGLLRSDDRFVIVSNAVLSLVVFRLKTSCDETRELLERITKKKKILMVSGMTHGKVAIRFVVGGFEPEEKDIVFAWEHILETLQEMEMERGMVRESLVNEVFKNEEEDQFRNDLVAMEILAEQLGQVVMEMGDKSKGI